MFYNSDISPAHYDIKEIEDYCQEYDITRIVLDKTIFDCYLKQFKIVSDLDSDFGYRSGDDTSMRAAQDLEKAVKACAHALRQLRKAKNTAQRTPSKKSVDRLFLAALVFAQTYSHSQEAWGCYYEALYPEHFHPMETQLQEEKSNRYHKQRRRQNHRLALFNQCKQQGMTDAAAYREIIRQEQPSLKPNTAAYLAAMNSLRVWKSRNFHNQK